MVNMIRIAIVVALAWCGAAILSWASYSPPRPPSMVGASQGARLPEAVSAPNLKSDAASLQRLAIWQKDPVSATTATSDIKAELEQWFRIAVAQEPTGNYVLLGSPSGATKSFKAGDTLPDGSKLIKVSVSEVVVQPPGGKKQSVHQLN